jgi:ParB-like nuclease domain
MKTATTTSTKPATTKTKKAEQPLPSLPKKDVQAMPWPADNVERRRVAELVPNARNARQHSTEQVRELAASIQEWGWTIPVLVDEQGTLIAGHGRVLAADLLGLSEIPVMTARGWTETQKRAYMLADNQLALHATWDYDLLKIELTELRADGIDLGLMGFGEMDLADIFAPDADEALKRYVQAVNTPVYEPKGDKPEVKDLVDRTKAQDLMKKIREAEGITDAERDFLLHAAARHNVFDYHQIAEFYCHASETMQALMEDSALVIIDFDKAIGDGFVRMSKRLDEVFLRSYPDGDGPDEGDLDAGGIGHVDAQ